MFGTKLIVLGTFLALAVSTAVGMLQMAGSSGYPMPAPYPMPSPYPMPMPYPIPEPFPRPGWNPGGLICINIEQAWGGGGIMPWIGGGPGLIGGMGSYSVTSKN